MRCFADSYEPAEAESLIDILEALLYATIRMPSGAAAGSRSGD
jgi:hypothetical protein